MVSLGSLAVLLGAVAASWLECPPSFNAAHSGNQIGPCDGGRLDQGTPPVTRARAGDRLKVAWPSNNKGGGLVRLALVPESEAERHDSFDSSIIKVACFGHDQRYGRFNESSGFCNHPCNGRPGGHHQMDLMDTERYDTSIGIPVNLEDGIYVLQWKALIGGDPLPHYSCAKLEIHGGSDTGKSCTPPPLKTVDCRVTDDGPKANALIKDGKMGPFCFASLPGSGEKTCNDVDSNIELVTPVNNDCDARLDCNAAQNRRLCERELVPLQTQKIIDADMKEKALTIRDSLEVTSRRLATSRRSTIGRVPFQKRPAIIRMHKEALKLTKKNNSALKKRFGYSSDDYSDDYPYDPMQYEPISRMQGGGLRQRHRMGLGGGWGRRRDRGGYRPGPRRRKASRHHRRSSSSSCSCSCACACCFSSSSSSYSSSSSERRRRRRHRKPARRHRRSSEDPDDDTTSEESPQIQRRRRGRAPRRIPSEPTTDMEIAGEVVSVIIPSGSPQRIPTGRRTDSNPIIVFENSTRYTLTTSTSHAAGPLFDALPPHSVMTIHHTVISTMTTAVAPLPVRTVIQTVTSTRTTAVAPSPVRTVVQTVTSTRTTTTTTSSAPSPPPPPMVQDLTVFLTEFVTQTLTNVMSFGPAPTPPAAPAPVAPAGNGPQLPTIGDDEIVNLDWALDQPASPAPVPAPAPPLQVVTEEEEEIDLAPSDIVAGQKCNYPVDQYFCAGIQLARCVHYIWHIYDCAPGTTCRGGACRSNFKNLLQPREH